MSAIQGRALEKEYRLGRNNVVRALDGADIDVERGELAAVLGRSGSGKSTLLNLIGGLDTPTGGSLTVGGTELSTLGPKGLAAYRAATVGFVFQSFHLQPRFLAWENVALPLVFSGVRRPERRRRATALLERVGLADRATHRPTELSGGEQQRVALARSLVADPKLILGDEPTGNLDTHTSEQIMDLLVEANRRGTTIVLVTHDQSLTQQYADRTILMEDGKVTSNTTRNGASS